MIRPRRALILIVLALLVAPVIAMPFTPAMTASLEENRTLAKPPTWPSTPGAWRQLPRALDAYLADHFAFREPALRLGMWVKQRVGVKAGAQALAVTGENGQMFLTEGLLRSTGLDVDPRRAADYADFLCQISSRIEATGAKVAVSLAPSPAGLMPDLAPAWAGPARTPTDYDLILADLAQCGAPAADLRPVLKAAAGSTKLFRKYDSHWTPRGALLAYDRMVQALGRPDWNLDAKDLRWAQVRLDDGDLPRMAGLAPQFETLDIHHLTGLPPGMTRAPLDGITGEAMQPFEVRTNHPGPTVLIIGDSFTADFFPPLFASFAGRVVWVHHDLCRFDWRVVERAKADYVLILPAERNALCHGQRPRGFPAS